MKKYLFHARFRCESRKGGYQNCRVELSAPDRERKHYCRAIKGFSSFIAVYSATPTNVSVSIFGFQTVQLKILAEIHCVLDLSRNNIFFNYSLGNRNFRN